MPTIITSVALSLLLFQSSGQGKKTDREYDGLNGLVRVARVEKEVSQDQTGNPNGNARGLDKIIKYDRSGRETEEVLFLGSSENSCAHTRRVFSYDDQDNRTEAIYRSDAIILGNKSGASQSPNLTVTLKTVFKWDDSGRRSEVTQYDSEGKLTEKWLYKYDDKGRVKEVVVPDGNSVQSRCSYSHNDKGMISEETCRYERSGGVNKSAFTYEYDANGNWIKKAAAISSTTPNGSSHESKQVFYREIKYYSAHDLSDQGQQKEAADMFDGTKLVPCPIPRIIRKSGGVLQGGATKRVKPEYPDAVRTARIGGTVVVEVTVDEAGKVISARALSGPFELQGVCEKAARGWEFQPTKLVGIPVKVIGTITFNFNL